MFVSLLQSVSFILNSVFEIALKITLTFAVLSFFDYLYQRWEYEKSIRMSKQEIKEEYKHTEGDPQVKGRIKEIQRQMATGRMMKQVQSADVVVKNPTHFAVALKYDPNDNHAPVVVAKGQDYMALKILKISEEYRIPTKENKYLARALYHSVELNKEIPPEFYSAMAEILAWVFTLKKGGGQAI
jgi:flagellar biosynthetic protein FlhB